MLTPLQPVAQRIERPLTAGVCRVLHGAAFFCCARSSSARRSKSAAINANKRVRNALSAAAAFSFEVLLLMAFSFACASLSTPHN